MGYCIEMRERLLIRSAAMLLALLAVDAHAQDDETCIECHDDVVVQSTAHTEEACIDCHTNVPPEHEDDDLEPLTDEESCGDCHRREFRTVGRSAHGEEVACNDCHGDPHGIHLVAESASAVSPVNQIQHCGDCHDEPAGLVEGYLVSEHGKGLLQRGLAAAPACSDCHNAHDTFALDDDRAPTAHGNSPEMCGSCHTLLFEEWTTSSAHGSAWLEENADGPVCTDCHNSHGVSDVKADENRLASSDNCGGCHEDYLETFRDSFHGKANALGLVTVATCADCHTPHRNLAATDLRSSVHPDNLVETCSNCHEGISESFTAFDSHNDPTDPDDNFAVYVVWVFMTGLLVGVFGFFGLHDFLWLQRSVVGKLRGEFPGHADESSGQFIRRFSKFDMRTHVVIIVTFLLLALTGLPLKFHTAAWAQPLMDLLGGVEAAGIIHRIAAIGTFGYAAFHLGSLFVRWAVRRERGLFWGPNSMVPQPKDIRDLFANFRYFLYMGERPPADRWTYFEKFDYLAVFWGVLIIGLSGLMVWLPVFFSSFLPGWVLNAAYVVHSDEALLATGFIFIFHFFHTHLRPESFPMDTVMFTGKMSLQRFKDERPLEYERMVASNELEDLIVEPPTSAELRKAYMWGSLFVAIGVALAIGIIWALLTH